MRVEREGTNRKSRHRLSLVFATVLAVFLPFIILGSESSARASANLSPSATSKTGALKKLWKQLERRPIFTLPYTLGTACPAGRLRDVLAPTKPSLNPNPNTLLVFTPARDPFGGYNLHLRWGASSKGLTLIRGRQLGGNGTVRFGAGRHPSPSLRLRTGAGNSIIRVSRPGCYEYQVDRSGSISVTGFEILPAISNAASAKTPTAAGASIHRFVATHTPTEPCTLVNNTRSFLAFFKALNKHDIPAVLSHIPDGRHEGFLWGWQDFTGLYGDNPSQGHEIIGDKKALAAYLQHVFSGNPSYQLTTFLTNPVPRDENYPQYPQAEDEVAFWVSSQLLDSGKRHTVSAKLPSSCFSTKKGWIFPFVLFGGPR